MSQFSRDKNTYQPIDWKNRFPDLSCVSIFAILCSQNDLYGSLYEMNHCIAWNILSKTVFFSLVLIVWSNYFGCKNIKIFNSARSKATAFCLSCLKDQKPTDNFHKIDYFTIFYSQFNIANYWWYINSRWPKPILEKFKIFPQKKRGNLNLSKKHVLNSNSPIKHTDNELILLNLHY